MIVGLGCDPGVKGAVACVCSERGFLAVEGLPTMLLDLPKGSKAAIKNRIDARALRKLLASWSTKFGFAQAEAVICVVERMRPFGPDDPAPPAIQMSMGLSAGLCEGAMVAFSTLTLTPYPQQWKKFYGLASGKGDSVDIARERFPNLPARLRHDKAEAILLAAWAVGGADLFAPAAQSEADDPFLPAVGARRAKKRWAAPPVKRPPPVLAGDDDPFNLPGVTA